MTTNIVHIPWKAEFWANELLSYRSSRPNFNQEKIKSILRSMLTGIPYDYLIEQVNSQSNKTNSWYNKTLKILLLVLKKKPVEELEEKNRTDNQKRAPEMTYTDSFDIMVENDLRKILPMINSETNDKLLEELESMLNKLNTYFSDFSGKNWCIAVFEDLLSILQELKTPQNAHNNQNTEKIQSWYEQEIKEKKINANILQSVFNDMKGHLGNVKQYMKDIYDIPIPQST